MSDFLPLPAAMVRRARDFSATPALARPAATVVLLRPSETEIEVYVIRRAATMVFGGVYAFPGGSVDPIDQVENLRSDWPQRLGLPIAEASAVVGAALREMTEETGVRLTEDLLFAWSRWITPEFEPRRFDTWFFVARLPEGQDARELSGEADRTLWITPVDAIAGYADGSMAMLPPTVSTLRELARYRRVDDVVASCADRDAARPVLPRVEFASDGSALLRLD